MTLKMGGWIVSFSIYSQFHWWRKQCARCDTEHYFETPTWPLFTKITLRAKILISTSCLFTNLTMIINVILGVQLFSRISADEDYGGYTIKYNNNNGRWKFSVAFSGCLRIDISDIDQASSFHHMLILLSFILASFLEICILFALRVSMNK